MNLSHLDRYSTLDKGTNPNSSGSAGDGGFEMSLPLFMLSLFFAIIKRPWITLLSVLIIVIPITFNIFSKVPYYRSSAKLMISQNSMTSLSGMTGGMYGGFYRDISRENRYMKTIGNSFEFIRNVRTRITREFPNLSPDTVAVVANSVKLQDNPREPEVLEIVVQYIDPNLTYRACIIAMEEFQNRLIELEREDGNKVLNFIEMQIEQMNAKLEKAEQELQTFLAENKFTLSDEQSNLTSELLELEKGHSEALAQLEMVRIDIDTYNKQIEELVDDLKRTTQTGNVQTEIEQLRAELDSIKHAIEAQSTSDTDKAQMQLLEEERQRILNQIIQKTISSTEGSSQGGDANPILSLRTLEEKLREAYVKSIELQNRVNYFDIQIKRFWDDHPELPQRILEYTRLKRTKEVIQQTSDILISKREEIRINIAGEQGGLKVIDSPEYPKAPIKESKLGAILIGVVVSLILGVIISGVVDYFDNTVKDENDIRKLGVSALGAIPVFPIFRKKPNSDSILDTKSEDTRGRDMLIYESQKSYITEAYRSLKISLQFAATDQGKNVFVVTSPGVGEGKSLTTANMGLVFAKSGKSTIVIDCDLRRSTLNRYFEISRKPGLTEHLLEGLELESIRRDTGFNNLSIITGGSAPPNPAELVSSRVMTDFVNYMRSEYDIVFIDSPPILVCTDPISIGENSDGIIILVKMEYTNLKTLEYAINTIRKIGIEIMGVIMNHISYRYGTAYYYFYRYYRPYTYYSTYRYYSYYYGEYSRKADAAKTGKKRRTSKKRED